MRTSKSGRFISHFTALAGCSACVSLLAPQAQAFPAGSVTFETDPVFKQAYAHSLTSGDGLVTVEGWLDANATVPGNLWQWWVLLGVDDPAVNDPPENGALVDVQESMTLQYDAGVGASMITFLNSGGIGGTANNLARVEISGFLSDPGAFPVVGNQPRILNLSYASGTLTFDYLWDGGNDYGRLLFSNPAASAGQRLKIVGSVSPNGDATSYGVAPCQLTFEETFGRPSVQPVNVRHNLLNAYTTTDGLLTVRGYSDRDATVPANMGTYLDQCFGVFGGNSGAVDGDETMTLQFASGMGLARLDTVYSQGQVSISGFLSDPGFTDPANASFGVQYADGVLSFYPLDGGFHRYYFTNRAASAGQTLKINSDPSPSYYFAIAGIDYAGPGTIVAGDLPNDSGSSFATPEGAATLNAFSDTPGTTPANLYVSQDWFGVAGGNNNEAIEGSESMNLHFAGENGLSSISTRYTSGQVVISGFTGDPGFFDPSGLASGINYANGVLSFTFDAYRVPEYTWKFLNPGASAGQTLTLRSASGQIALTRISTTTAPVAVTLSIARQGENVVLTWPSGVLQQSTDLSGEFVDVEGAVSPHSTPASGTRFFRVRVP